MSEEMSEVRKRIFLYLRCLLSTLKVRKSKSNHDKELVHLKFLGIFWSKKEKTKQLIENKY